MGALEDTMLNRDICKPASNVWQYRTPLSGHWSNSNGKGEAPCNLLLETPPCIHVFVTAELQGRCDADKASFEASYG